jgi:tetratricopeptide (TPR) repeat protein
MQDKLTQALAMQQRGMLSDAERIYEEILRQQPDHFAALHRLGVLALQMNRAERGVALLERAIKLNPAAAAAQCNLGIALFSLNRCEEAVASYDKAIALRPDDATAHNNRGAALWQLNRHEAALLSYDKAIELKPDYTEAYDNRGVALAELQRYEAALASHGKAIALKPHYAKAHSNRGIALADLQRYEDALASYDEAMMLDPDLANAPLNKSLCLLQLGRLEEGWKLYEWRKRRKGHATDRPYAQPLWLGQQDIAGKTLFIYWEQGLGDTLQFCRYASLLKRRGANIVMSVQDPLRRLLGEMDSTIRVIGGNQEPRDFDFHCPLMSLPLALGTTLETIPGQVPYLIVNPQRSASWRKRLAALPGRKIGLVWAGTPLGDRPHGLAVVQRRSITLGQYAPLSGIPGLCLISLQKGEAAESARTPPDGMVLHDWTAELNDFADTAALVEALDLVISVDTSVAHLAGALGKPVWVLNRYDQCWRWLTARTDSPWYPTARLFRQKAPGNWNGVIDEVTRALSAL